MRTTRRRPAGRASGRSRPGPRAHLLPDARALGPDAPAPLGCRGLLRRRPDVARADRPVEGAGLHPAPDDGRLVGPVPGLSLRPVRRRPPRGRGADGSQRPRHLARRRRLLHVAGRELRQVPLPGRQAGDGRRRRGDPPRGARVLGPGRLRQRLPARVEVVLPRGLDPAAHLARCAVSRLDAEVLPLSPRTQASLRFRQGGERPDRAARQVLRADAQPDQLRPLEDRQPRVEPDRGRGRRLHRPGLDGDRAHAERLSGRAPRADVRGGVLRIRRDDERRAGRRRPGLVPQRSDRGQPRPLLGGLPHQLGEHPDGLAPLAAGLAIRGDALARADLPRQVPRGRPEPPQAGRARWPARRSRPPMPPS